MVGIDVVVVCVYLGNGWLDDDFYVVVFVVD